MKRKRCGLLFLLLLCLAGCGGEKSEIEAKTETLTVVTSFYPVYLLAQEVTAGAEGIKLYNMAQPQTGCLHDYEMTIADMKLLEQADVLIVNGGGMEGFLQQAIERYPDLKVVDTSAGIELLEEESHHHHAGETEEEHAAHAHDHEENSHLWLSPMRAAEQAENICAALREMDAADGERFTTNTAAFREEMERLTAEAEAVELPTEAPAAVFHEGFAYLAELFGLEVHIGIFTDEYQEPSAKELAEAAEEAKEENIRFFLAAEDNGEKYARTLAAENGKEILLLDPLTMEDAELLSYGDRMRKNIEAVRTFWEVEAK